MQLEYLSDNFAVSDQIEVEDLSGLKAQGFTEIFCHRPDHEDTGQTEFEVIAEAARALGLTAHHLPVVPGQISGEDEDAFQRLLDEAQGPVLAYCKSGGRAKMLWKTAQT